MLKKKETNDSKNKELLVKVVCYGCGQTGHMVKDKECPKNNKNNKDKKETTMQIYMAREMSQKRVNHTEVHNTSWKEKKQDLRTNPKKRKKYGCIRTEQRNSKKTLKKQRSWTKRTD